MTNTVKPSRQEMIEEIYKKIAERNIKKINDQIAKITCKPVMIWDVIDWIEKNSESYKPIIGEKFFMTWVWKKKKIKILSECCLFFWKEKRKPIEEQSDECIEFVYNLISE